MRIRHLFRHTLAAAAALVLAVAYAPGALADAAVDRASAVVSIVSNDLVNLEVGLNARALHPRIRVILRIFDRDTADELRQRLNIHYAISASAIAAREMLSVADGVWATKSTNV